MDKKRLVYNHVMKIKDVKRILLLCEAVDIFLKMYEGDYHILKNKKDVVNFIERYSIPNDKPLVFGDISFLNELEQNCLLKFIEEAPVPMIVLASQENLPLTIISRFLKILKIPYPLINQESNYTLREFIKYKKNFEENYPNIYFDCLTESIKYCPDYYRIAKAETTNKNISEDVIDLCIANINFE